MYKNYTKIFCTPNGYVHRLLIIMKLTTFIILFSLMQVSAATFGQNLTLKEKNISYSKLFFELRKQTGYSVLVKSTEFKVSKRFDANFQNTPVDIVMKEITADGNLDYVVEDKTIVIKQKEKSLLEKVAAIFQTIDIMGKVTDENGAPLSGANVKVKGTAISVMTDEFGNFQLNNVDEKAVIVISYLGYETKEINAKKEVGVIKLQPVSSRLEEVTINKGYYLTTQALNTGTVGKLSAEEISRQPVANPLAALQGRIPGLLITQTTGLPGANFTVQIRGRNSIQSGNVPLYIVDGVIYNSDNLSRAASSNINSPFSTLTPDDIERIEVLKDADATSLYGSRGANGVILITTKRGKSGKPQIEANFSHGWGRPTQLPELLNRQEFLQMRKEAHFNAGVTPTELNAGDIVVWDTTRNTNWEEVIMAKAARHTNAQLRFSGGNELNTYSVGANYFGESTVYNTDQGNKRISFSTALSTQDKAGRISFSLTSLFSNETNQLPASDPYGNLLQLAPHAPELYNSEGLFNFGPSSWPFINPIADQLNQYKSTANRMNTSGIMTIKILDNFKFRASGGINLQDLNENRKTPILSQNPINNPRGATAFSNSRSQSWIAESQLDYNLNLGKSTTFTALAGFSTQQSYMEGSTQLGAGYTSDLLINTIAGAAQVAVSDSRSDYKYVALFTRIELNHKDKYVLNLTGRRDGSSRFGPGNRYANFGAIGAAWILSAESWLKESRIINFAKLRVSFGLVGNDQIGNYQFYDALVTTSYPYNGQAGLRPARLFNPDYSWEQKANLDLGVELAFLSNRIQLNGTYFRSESGNQIIQYSLPTQTGTNAVLKNFPGLVRNTGIEIDLSTKNLSGNKLQWSTTANLTVARNKLVEFPGLLSSSYASTYAIGKPLDIQFLYNYTGVNPQTGLYTFEDINGDGLINVSDRKSIISRVPRFYGGLGNDVSFKQWSLSFFFQFVAQNGTDGLMRPTPLGTGRNIPRQGLDRWRKPGDQTRYQRYSTSGGLAGQAAALVSTSTGSIIGADFIRLKNIQFAYTFANAQLKKLKLSSASIFCQAQNLLTISSYKVADPENQSFLTLPPLRMVRLGIRATY